MARSLVLLAILAVVAPVAAAASGPPVISDTRGPKTRTVKLGTTLILRLSNGGVNWSVPTVRGKAISLRRVRFARDPGYRQWTVRARARGRAMIVANGVPACEPHRPCALGPLYLFEATIIVR